MVEKRQAEDRGKVEEGVVACPHHLHHAKISGKLEKKARTSCAAARSSKCLIQITLHRQAVCTRERDDSTFPEAVFLWFRTNWEKG